MSSASSPRSRSRPQITRDRSRAGIDLFLLLCIAAGARVLWMWMAPPQAYSVDLHDWRIIAGSLNVGLNPYAKYGVLNWPPFWMESLYMVMGLSIRFDVDPITCIRCYLIFGDLLVLCVLFRLMKLLDGQGKYGLLLLFGYCLNPLLIFLTIQHGNFDVFATMWVLLCLVWLIRFRRQGNPVDWLAAAGCLGMGVFTKTFPLLLWPILVPGARRLGWRAAILGILLVTMPTVLSLAPLYVLSPASISRDVLGYRSFGTGFGVLSLLRLGGMNALIQPYTHIFPTLFFVLLAGLAICLWWRDLPNDDDLVLFSALLLLSTFTLGTGYGSQYWFWVIPLLIIAYRQFPGPLRIILWIAAIVTIATSVFEYAIEKKTLGGFWYWHSPSDSLDSLEQAMLQSPTLGAMVHLPMTLASLAILAVGTGVLLARSKPKNL